LLPAGQTLRLRSGQAGVSAPPLQEKAGRRKADPSPSRQSWAPLGWTRGRRDDKCLGDGLEGERQGRAAVARLRGRLRRVKGSLQCQREVCPAGGTSQPGGRFGAAAVEALPMAGAAAGGVVLVPGLAGNEAEAAGGVGAAYKQVEGGFWHRPLMRCDASSTHNARPPVGG